MRFVLLVLVSEHVPPASTRTAIFRPFFESSRVAVHTATWVVLAVGVTASGPFSMKVRHPVRHCYFGVSLEARVLLFLICRCLLPGVDHTSIRVSLFASVTCFASLAKGVFRRVSSGNHLLVGLLLYAMGTPVSQV